MSWNLFLDDERDPPRDGREWLVARSVKEANDMVTLLGVPSYISFDHDLGDSDRATGKYFAECLVAADQSGHIELPEDFDFYVHSQNPIGKENIEKYLRNYLRVRDV